MKASEYLQSKSASISKSSAIVKLETLLSQHSNTAKNDNTIAFVDPGTIIAAAKTVVDVYNFLFGRNKEDEIEKMIEYLKEEIDHVIDLLNEVVDLLKELPVLFFEQLKQLAILQLKGSIYNITDNYSSWKKDPKANQIEITTLLDNLKSNSIVAMGYGYTHYDSIALALTQEYALSKLLGKTTETINSSLTRYKSYFSMAVNYAVKGSLADAKNTIALQMQNLSNQFPVQQIDCGTQSYRSGRCDYAYHIYVTVGGDITNGFTFSQQNGPGQQTGCDPHEGHGPLKNTFKKNNYTESYNSPLSFAYVDPQNYISAYNNAHVQYTALLNDATTLQQAIDNCNTYIELISKLMAS